MIFNIGPLTDSQISAAHKPEIATDTEVYAAKGRFETMATIDQTGDQPTDFTSTLFPVGLGDGRDLQLLAVNGIEGAAANPIEAKIDVVYADDSTGTMTATFDLPPFTFVQANCLPVFSATDFIHDDAANDGKLIKEITSVTTVSNGLVGQTNKFKIIATQPEAEWFPVGCLTSFSGEFPVAKSVAVGCGKNPQAFSREGTPEVQEVSTSFKYVSSNDGLARLSGHTVTLWVKTVKDSSVHWENRFFSGVVANTSPTDRNGEGDDEVVATLTGTYEIGAIGYAR